MLLIPAAMIADQISEASAADSSANGVPHLHGDYDVIVVGGDPEGICGAIGAARAGARTLLVDTRPVPGGLFTRGWLNVLDMNRGPDGRLLNKGLFSEWFCMVEGEAFSIDTAKRAFYRLLRAEPGLDLWFGVEAVEPIIDNIPQPLIDPGQSGARETVAARYRSKPWQSDSVESKDSAVVKSGTPHMTGVRIYGAGMSPRIILSHVCIDATQDGDLAAAAGAGFTIGREDCAGMPYGMAATLIFRLDGIGDKGWKELLASITDSSGRKIARVFQEGVWGFNEIMKTYRATDPNVGVRGLNIGRQSDGSVLINALHLYDIDALDLEQRKLARARANLELPHLVQFLVANIPGFEHAFLSETAPELYIRETRHFECLYRLTVDDVLENRDFSDTIAYGSYPLDIQAVDANFRGDIVGKPARYGIPLRCLVPGDVDGLFICGRAAGFDSMAHSSARVVPVGMATGQAAGVAAALSIKRSAQHFGEKSMLSRIVTNTDFIIACRRELARQGVELDLRPVGPPPETRHWAYPGLKYLRRRGLASGEYENRYALDEAISGLSFINGLSGVSGNMPKRLRQHLYAEGEAHKTLTLDTACGFLVQRLGHTAAFENPTVFLRNRHVLDDKLEAHIKANSGILTRGAAYMLLKNYSERFPLTDAD
ncbi:MAG: FAD-dependent oxidoreductase [Candidatus Riflebacteria bacterium]|nr:FAD-dependent oxidoreductase [Candidatus Riflebacteria bacterium]